MDSKEDHGGGQERSNRDIEGVDTQIKKRGMHNRQSARTK